MTNKHGRASLLSYLRTFEPARLRAAWVAIVALLAALGVSVSDVVDDKVGAILAAAGVLIPLVQGELTRAAVYAPGNVAVAIDDVGTQVAGPGSSVGLEGDPVSVMDTAGNVGLPDGAQATIPEGIGFGDEYGPGPFQLDVARLEGDPVDEDGDLIMTTPPSTTDLEEQDRAGS